MTQMNGVPEDMRTALETEAVELWDQTCTLPKGHKRMDWEILRLGPERPAQRLPSKPKGCAPATQWEVPLGRRTGRFQMLWGHVPHSYANLSQEHIKWFGFSELQCSHLRADSSLHFLCLSFEDSLHPDLGNPFQNCKTGRGNIYMNMSHHTHIIYTHNTHIFIHILLSYSSLSKYFIQHLSSHEALWAVNL